MTRKLLVALLTSVLLLPASCGLGVVAGNMQGTRLGGDAGEGGPLWVENLLWIGALALMIVWAQRIGRLYSDKLVETAPEETGS